jgi:dTDP-L-rhamnose 4-epimerase
VKLAWRSGVNRVTGNVLITGGAGFIGSRLCRALAPRHSLIVVLDNLHPQIHGPEALPPAMPDNVLFRKGAVEDRAALGDAISAADPCLVYHLAAETGTGQSYDEIARYCTVNVTGTALLVEELKRRAPRLERVVLAGSRAVYGEGAHVDQAGRRLVPAPRSLDRMRAGDFQPRDASGGALLPVPTPETAAPQPSSIYASTKLMQEYVVTQGFAATRILPVILRFQNVYGPGQSLRNPYTGVLSIFCSQILDGKALNIFEDGEIVRDFIYVDDVVDALVKAGAAPDPGAEPINIGSGEAQTILAAARTLLRRLGAPETGYAISGDFRPGDIRYAVADISRAGGRLGWQPRVPLADGLAALADWARAERQEGH